VHHRAPRTLSSSSPCSLRRPAASAVRPALRSTASASSPPRDQDCPAAQAASGGVVSDRAGDALGREQTLRACSSGSRRSATHARTHERGVDARLGHAVLLHFAGGGVADNVRARHGGAVEAGHRARQHVLALRHGRETGQHSCETRRETDEDREREWALNRETIYKGVTDP
jgi:hypothetical protein